MGRQFSFYLLPSDANLLVGHLQERFEAKLLLDYSLSFELLEIDSPVRVDQVGDLGPLSSHTRYYLAPPSGHIERSYFPKPDWWVIDSDSEGIEFSSCRFSETAVAIGRFWYEIDVVRNLQFVPKSNEFVKWSEAVYRYVKKSLHYDRGIDVYLGKEAARFRDKGGRLVRDIWPNGKVIPA
jgi:hypothetical protein